MPAPPLARPGPAHRRARRTVTGLAAGLLAASALAGCGLGGSEADANTIRLGLIGPMSGAQAQIGENQLQGATIAVDQINAAGGVDGKQLELVTRDEGISPDVAAAAVRDLAGDDVTLQLGMLSSANCLATAPTLPRLRVVMVAANCTNDALTGTDGGEAPNPNFFRVGTPDSLIVRALATVVAQKFPDVVDYSAFGYDYVTGTTQWGIYQDTVEAAGVPVEVEDETFVALGEQNFKPYVQALTNRDAPPETSALYLGTYGSGTASFLQQAQDLDLTSNYALLVQPGGYYPVARTLGGAAPDVWNAYDYNYAAFDSEMNTAFVDDYRAAYDRYPVDWSYDAYLAVQAYAAAIEEAGSTDYQDVLDALPGIEFEGPSGPLTIDATTHQADTPVVVTNTVGDASAPEDVKVLFTQVVAPDEAVGGAS